MIVNAGYRGKVGASVPKFTYTGTYNVREDGVVELLTSGTLVFLADYVIDRFMVGGGGAGGRHTGATPSYGGGGGGGYTRTDKNISVTKAINIPIIIGEGGAPGTSSAPDGKSTTWANDSVAGGTGARTMNSSSLAGNGGKGGSGGGGGVVSNSDYGAGGSNGANGEQGSYGSAQVTGGTGQGSTTREFGETSGKLYAGGGGGGRYMVSATPIVSIGGTGGGGTGAWQGASAELYQAAAAGVANTGGGGGGGAGRTSSSDTVPGASGGSGIVCFRFAK